MAHEPPTSSSVIHIPATEFPTSHTPLPHPRPKVYSPDRARRRLDADHHRAAALRSMAHRCRAHVRHAANVATTVKAKRLADAQLRHRALANTLAHANDRRLQHLSRRARSSPQRSETVQRQRRERKTKYNSRHIGRLKAGERRSRILSERKERAGRFSPPRNKPPSESSSTLSFDSPVVRTLQFGTSSARPVDSLFSSSVPQPVDSTNKSTAAARIASYYLLFRARAALTAAGVLGPQIASYDFARLTVCLETQDAQDAAELVLRALGFRDRARRTAAHEAAERRVLLSCLVIALHPTAVLDRSGSNRNKEEALTLCCARRMLLCLQAGTLSAVSQAWLWWKTAFATWKKRDAETMLRTMIEDAVATESMRVAVNKGFLHSENVRALRHALGGRHEDEESSRQEHAAWEEGIARKQEMLRKGIVKLAGKAGERRLNLALSASRHAHNERMVHEILVDLPALLGDIRNPTPIAKEVWDRLRAELSEDPPVRDELASRLAEISGTLNAMMPGSFGLQTLPSPIDLDVNFAISVVCTAAEALKECQAKAFDDALQEWQNDAVLRLRNAHEQFIEVVVDVLEELTKLIRRSHIYVLLFRVRHSVPVVQQYGAAWERAHFQGHIDSGKFSKKLPRTRLLLRQILPELQLDHASMRADVKTVEPRTLRLMMTKGVAKLASEMKMRSAEELPEVLFLDHERIVRIQNDVQRCALVGSLDNIGRQFLLSKGLTICTEIRKELLEVTEKENTTLQDIQDTFLGWIDKVLRTEEKILCDSDRGLLLRMVERTVQPGNKTFDIIFKRVVDAIVEVSEKMGSERSRSSSGSWKGLDNVEECKHNQKGLEGVNKVIDEVSSRICSLVLHVLSVHGESVREVVRSL